LGQNDKAKKIEIRWPSGIVQTLENVRADKILMIDEMDARMALPSP
jgi:hypothetical protein